MCQYPRDICFPMRGMADFMVNGCAQVCHTVVARVTRGLGTRLRVVCMWHENFATYAIRQRALAAAPPPSALMYLAGIPPEADWDVQSL